MAGKQAEISPSGATVAKNIQRLREAQRITFAELSRTLDGIGRAIPPLGLRRIEASERRVDVDDLFALAIALRTTPSTLLTPNADSADETVAATGFPDIPARQLWKWVTGQSPIHDKPADVTSYIDWGTTALPKWRQLEVANGLVELIELRRAELDAEQGDRARLDNLLEKYRADGDG